MQTQSLSCCTSCFPGEVANKNAALYTECLGLSFHPRLRKEGRALGRWYVKRDGVEKPHHPHHDHEWPPILSRQALLAALAHCQS